MNFTKRTTFKDKLDEEIYVFHLMLNLAQEMYGKSHDTDFVHSDALINIRDDKEYFRISVQLKHKSYEICEMSGIGYFDIMNVWLKEHSGITRIKESRYYGKFSVTDGDSESDELLDSYLVGGVNRIPEEIYFQESLVRDDHMFEYKDIDRLLEALNVEFPLDMAFLHERVPSWDYNNYNELYDLVLEKRIETK